jgi:hypothetical protein
MSRHPAGLLLAAQFSQIALVVTEKAAVEDMGMKGFIQKDWPLVRQILSVGLHR